MYANIFYPIINHNTYSSYAAIWFAYFFIVATENKQWWRYAVVGMLGGFVFIFLQTKGAILCLAAAGLIVLLPNAPLGRRFGYLVTMCGGVIISLATLLFRWEVPTLWRNLVTYPNNTNWQVNHFINPVPVTITAIAITVILFDIAWHRWDKKFWILATFQAALWISTLNLIEKQHLVINAFPLCIMVVVLFQNIWEHARHYLLKRTLVLGVVASCLFVVAAIFSAVTKIVGNSIYTIDILRLGHRSGFWVDADFQQSPFIYAGPFMPGLYFELGKSNPFRYPTTLICNNECMADTLKTLEDKRPLYAILNYGLVKKYDYSTNNIVDYYLQNHYVPCEPIASQPTAQPLTCLKLKNP
jgi:hypothetical protein